MKTDSGPCLKIEKELTTHINFVHSILQDIHAKLRIISIDNDISFMPDVLVITCINKVSNTTLTGAPR